MRSEQIDHFKPVYLQSSNHRSPEMPQISYRSCPKRLAWFQVRYAARDDVLSRFSSSLCVKSLVCVVPSAMCEKLLRVSSRCTTVVTTRSNLITSRAGEHSPDRRGQFCCALHRLSSGFIVYRMLPQSPPNLPPLRLNPPAL